MKYNKKCIITSITLFILGLPPLFSVWFVDYYFGIIHIIFLIIFLLAIKYFHSQKCLTTFLTIFITLFILAIITLAIQGEYESKKRGFFYHFDQTVENSNLKNITGLGFADLSLKEEKEIRNIIKKAFAGQWNYYYDKDENKLDKFIKDLYLPEEYLLFKEEIKETLKHNQEQYEYINFTKEDVPDFIKKIEFSKFRKYRNLDDRVGVMAGFSGRNSLSMQYFLFRKVNDQWKIEREKITYTSPHELPSTEASIIEELIIEKQ